MIDAIDLPALSRRLERIESVALIRKVLSTNAIGRRVMVECIDGDLALPRAIIIAREQTGGRGRGERSWHSPANRGIYATILHSRPLEEIGALPLEVAVAVATFLEETWKIEARIKWPNDILVRGRKIAGILIEGRNHEGESYLAIGIGLNVMPLGSDSVPAATSVAEASGSKSVGLGAATEAFIEFFDKWSATSADRERTLEQWTRLATHNHGDRIECLVGDQIIRGTWDGLDTDGRAVLRQGENSVTIAAGDLIPLDGLD